MCIPHAKAMQRPRTHLKFSLVLSDGYKAQMAHVKALNKAKNKNIEEGPESPHHTPITGRGRNDSDDEGPVSQLLSSVWGHLAHQSYRVIQGSWTF